MLSPEGGEVHHNEGKLSVMSSHFAFPKPKEWNTFEDVVCDVFSRKFDNHNFQRYGRSGQRQFGVDIAGPTIKGLLGIQCKHHPDGNISLSEIDDEIAKSESFLPQLGEFIIATSADRDATAHGHVLQVSEARKANGKYPVGIKFWQDIYDWLGEFPELVYRHFSRYFPLQELENFHYPNLGESRKTTVSWPTSLEALVGSIRKTVGGIDMIEPYKLTMGVSSFPGTTFGDAVDLEVLLAEHFADEDSSETDFLKVGEILNDVKAAIQGPQFSKELVICLQARLSLALLLGWVFRQVSQFDLKLIFGNQIWATSGLPLVQSRMIEELPTLIDQGSDEVVVSLCVSRSIELSVLEFISSWRKQPRAMLVYALEGQAVTSAAHALSISIDVSRRIKTLIDKWQVRKIHLFGAMPAGLATLIGYRLNAICPISIYFMDTSRTQYRLAGTLYNSM